jgi:hypothetical protein
LENPGKPALTPHMSEPRCFTVLRVCAEAEVAARAAAIANVVTTRFMTAFPLF